MITVAFVGFYDHAIPPALKNPEESCDKSGPLKSNWREISSLQATTQKNSVEENIIISTKKHLPRWWFQIFFYFHP